MAMAGHRVTVWTPSIGAMAPEREREGLVEVIRYPAWQIVANYPIPKFWQSLFWRQLRSLLAVSDSYTNWA